MLRRGSIAILVATLVSASVAVPATPARACSISATPGSYAYGSDLGGNALIVCASTASGGSSGSSSVVSVGQSKPRTLVPPVKPTVTCRIVSKMVFIGPPTYATRYIDSSVCISNAQLHVPAKQTAKTTVNTSKPSTPASPPSNSSDQSSFRPDPIQLWAARAQLRTGETVTLTARTTTHLKQAVILGQAVTVRFTPVLVQWNFGDGPGDWLDIAASTQSNSFAYTGSQPVSASVRFSAAFRFAGQSNWTSQAGYLTSDDSLTLVVADPQPGPIAAIKSPNPRVRLVVNNCLNRPQALGCP